MIYNLDDSFNCYTIINDETYYHAHNIIRQMNQIKPDEEYGVDINNLINNGVRFFDKENKTLIENVPYEMVENRIFISKLYYENTILPLII